MQILDNQKCEEKICKLMGKRKLNESNIENITHDILEKCTSDELKAFILARKKDLPKSKLPKKGKLGDAIVGSCFASLLELENSF